MACCGRPLLRASSFRALSHVSHRCLNANIYHMCRMTSFQETRAMIILCLVDYFTDRSAEIQEKCLHPLPWYVVRCPALYGSRQTGAGVTSGASYSVLLTIGSTSDLWSTVSPPTVLLPSSGTTASSSSSRSGALVPRDELHSTAEASSKEQPMANTPLPSNEGERLLISPSHANAVHGVPRSALPRCS